MPSDEDKTLVGVNQEGYPCLEILSGPRGSGRFPIRSGTVRIGRMADSDIVLDDASVSRRHVVLELREEGLTLTDEGSRNGTKVSGQRLEPHQPFPIPHNTVIQIGAYRLRFLNEPAPLPPEPEPQEASPPPAVAGEEPPAVEEVAEEGVPPLEVKGVRRRRWVMWGGGAFAVLLLAVVGLQLVDIGSKRQARREKPATRESPEGEVGGVLPTTDEEPAPRERRVVFLDFSSNPIPGKVFFGEKEIGQTPFRVSTELEDEKWYEAKIVFQLPEVEEAAEEVVPFQSTPGTEIIPVAFDGKIGVFKVASLPREVDLYLEGYFEKDPYRAKPIKFAEIVFGKPIYTPFGRYVLELRRSRQVEGSQTFVDQVVYRREFFLKSEQTNYTADVKEEDLQFFPVQITSIPPGAKVLVDEREVGVTPYAGTLPVGSHLLVLRREGFFDFSQVMKMEINTPFVAEIPLKTTEAGELVNRATDLIRANRHMEGLPVLVEALNKNPTPRESAEVSYLIGICYLRQKSYSEAEGYFSKAMQHPEIKQQARLGLANVTYLRGDPVKALQLLVEVLVAAEDPRVRSDGGLLFQQLSPLKSVLYVASDPTTAQIFVNGMPIPQPTPMILHDLSVGTYRIEVKKEGFHPSEVKLNLGVSEFRPVVVKLTPLE